jgi:hypothetical protein
MLLCLLVMLVLQIVWPYWWWVMIVPFVFGAASTMRGWPAFRTGFLAAGLLWLGAGTYLYLTGARIIAARMARLFGFGQPWPLILVTAAVAALAAGLSGYAGCAVRDLFERGGKEERP